MNDAEFKSVLGHAAKGNYSLARVLEELARRIASVQPGASSDGVEARLAALEAKAAEEGSEETGD